MLSPKLHVSRKSQETLTHSVRSGLAFLAQDYWVICHVGMKTYLLRLESEINTRGAVRSDTRKSAALPPA